MKLWNRGRLRKCVFRLCGGEALLPDFKPPPQHPKNLPISSFFKGGISLPLFKKEGPGEILSKEVNEFCPSKISILPSLVLILMFPACTPKGPPVSESEVKAVFEKAIPSNIDDKAWEQIPVHHAKLLLQDMVEPRLMQASTAFVDVQSVTDGQKIIFRLNWNDPTLDDVPGPGRFGDAVAVQLPAAPTPDVPAPQMGENGKPVEITYWSAIFQAMINGRKDDIQAIYPNANVGHYPFEAAPLKQGSPTQLEMAKRYAPARSLENPMSGPRTVPVQDLIAEGPGTLRAAEKILSNGSGKHSQAGWTVVIVRPFPSGVQPGGRTQVAFAVWEGSHQEVGAKKMRTAWIPLSLGSSK